MTYELLVQGQQIVLLLLELKLTSDRMDQILVLLSLVMSAAANVKYPLISTQKKYAFADFGVIESLPMPAHAAKTLCAVMAKSKSFPAFQLKDGFCHMGLAVVGEETDVGETPEPNIYGIPEKSTGMSNWL